MDIRQNSGRIAYLSGAPRVSTRSDAETGGPRSHVLGTLTGFRRLGWDVETFIVGDRVPSAWVTEGSNARKQGGIVKKALVDCVRLGMRLRNNVTARRALSVRPNLVYERFACMQALGAPFKRAGVPWVLETNALLFKEFKQDLSAVLLSRLARSLEFSAYRQCDALVCISHELKKLILSEFELPESKIIVLPNGVDTDFFQPIEQAERAEDGSLTIGFVGMFYAWQALDLLLEAVHELRQRNLDIRIALVGNGPEQEHLAELVMQYGMQACVSFPGRLPRAEVPEAIADFDLGFAGHTPTRSGVMYMSPLKLYEYMAVGKPVLVSRNADSESLVADGETGFFFTAGNKESLKQSIRSAMARKQAFASMGKKARDVIEQHHSWQKRMETLLEELEPIIGNRVAQSMVHD